MFIATTYSGFDDFTNDLEEFRTAEEQHLNGNQIAEELKEELDRLGNDGEESHVYRSEQCEFHFTMEDNDGLTLSIRYAGYTKI
jgi:hypothetical protein